MQNQKFQRKRESRMWKIQKMKVNDDEASSKSIDSPWQWPFTSMKPGAHFVQT
jgi:hypothetical protein